MAMTDNDVITLIIETLNEQLPTWPFGTPVGNIVVQQKQQPVKQGIPVALTVYVEKLFDRVHGSPGISYTPGTLPDTLVEHETQVYATTFQISAFAIQKPNNPLLPTASDLASAARFILQRRLSIRKFNAAGAGLFRVTDVRNDYFTDDRDRQEGGPSFDVVVTYERTAEATVNAITDIDYLIVQVP